MQVRSRHVDRAFQLTDGLLPNYNIRLIRAGAIVLAGAAKVQHSARLTCRTSRGGLLGVLPSRCPAARPGASFSAPRQAVELLFSLNLSQPAPEAERVPCQRTDL